MILNRLAMHIGCVNMRGHEGTISIGQLLPNNNMYYANIRWSLHKAIHIMVQNVAMVCASIHLAPINRCENLCAVYINDLKRCPIVDAMHIEG